MKNKISIAHFNGREQQALLRLKNKIVAAYQPLIIYLIACNQYTRQARHSLYKPRNCKEWLFSCDLLLVQREGMSLPEDAEQELKTLSQEYDHIRLMAYPFDFVAKKLTGYSLFFCWLQCRAIILYESENASQKLPAPVQNMKQYEQQAHRFFASDDNYENQMDETLSPLPQKNTAPLQQEPCGNTRLNAELQNKMAEFLKDHGAKATGIRLRQAMIEYTRSLATVGIPNEFKNILWDFEELMEFFDLAETEFQA